MTKRIGTVQFMQKTFQRVLTLVTLIVLGLVFATAGYAETVNVTSQAQTIHGEWLAYAPAPETPKTVCLVDTGVTLNPDTEPAIIHREAIDGGDPADLSAPEWQHGTGLAMVMAAPKNDWGTVGISPHIKIASIRTTITQQTINPGIYIRGIQRCQRLRTEKAIATTELAISGVPKDQQQVSDLRDLIEFLGRFNISAVSGAGNVPGPMLFPAAIPGVVSVGGYNAATGGLCDVSSFGAVILAPGCGVDVAFPLTGEPALAEGTSPASAMVAAVLTALRSYRPDLTSQAAEELLVSTADQTAAGKLVNVEAMFRAAGLGAIVDAGKAATPQPPPEKPPPTTPNPPPEIRLPAPKLKKVTRKGDRIVVRTVPLRDYDVTLVVQVFRGKVRKKTVKSDDFTAKIRYRGATKIVCFYTFSGLRPSQKVAFIFPKSKKRKRS